MEVALGIVLVLLVFVLLTSSNEANNSRTTFRVFYSSKTFNQAAGCSYTKPKFEDIVATSPEEAVAILQEKLLIEQNRERKDLGALIHEYSEFKAIKL